MTQAASKTERPKIGDEGEVDFGAHRVHVRVIEDRGSLGVGGAQILRVQALDSDAAPYDTFEIPASSIRFSRSRRSRR